MDTFFLSDHKPSLTLPLTIPVPRPASPRHQHGLFQNVGGLRTLPVSLSSVPACQPPHCPRHSWLLSVAWQHPLFLPLRLLLPPVPCLARRLSVLRGKRPPPPDWRCFGFCLLP